MEHGAHAGQSTSQICYGAESWRFGRLAGSVKSTPDEELENPVLNKRRPVAQTDFRMKLGKLGGVCVCLERGQP